MLTVRLVTVRATRLGKDREVSLAMVDGVWLGDSSWGLGDEGEVGIEML